MPNTHTYLQGAKRWIAPLWRQFFVASFVSAAVCAPFIVWQVEPTVASTVPTEAETAFLGVGAPELFHAAAPTSMDPRLKRIIERRLLLEEQKKKKEKLHKAFVTRANNKIGVYLSAPSVGRETFLEQTIDALVAAGGDALIFDVKGSRVYFHSAAPIANEVSLVQPLYDLPGILAYAKSRGLYTIGRFIAIKDDGFTQRKPATRVRHPKTNAVMSPTWVDPANEEAIAYNMEVLCEVAKAGIDEINLDYIRFPTENAGALRVYSAAEKADKVEIFIKNARETIDRCGPDTKLGISTYAILGWSYDVNVETLGQDVIRFAPLLDIISPMAYPATFAAGHYYNPAKDPVSRMYYLVYRTLTGYRELLGPEHANKLRPWIQGYSVTKKNVQDQIRAVYDAGSCGFTVWNAGNAYSNTYAAIQAQERPSHCDQ